MPKLMHGAWAPTFLPATFAKADEPTCDTENCWLQITDRAQTLPALLLGFLLTPTMSLLDMTGMLGVTRNIQCLDG
jgi:hypothetical protein